MHAPLEITIFPDGKIAALDHTLLPTMEGTVKMERTSEIIFHEPSKTFVIYMIKAAKYVCYWHWNYFVKECRDYDHWKTAAEAVRNVSYLNKAVSLNQLYLELYIPKTVDNFLLGFETYEQAVNFENWIIPFLRNRDGYNEY